LIEQRDVDRNDVDREIHVGDLRDARHAPSPVFLRLYPSRLEARIGLGMAELNRIRGDLDHEPYGTGPKTVDPDQGSGRTDRTGAGGPVFKAAAAGVDECRWVRG
jgi:hypothetical protein